MATNQRPDPIRESARLTRRGFGVMAAGAVAGVIGWNWFFTGGDDDEDVVSPHARKALEWNEAVTRRVLYSNSHRAPEFPLDRAGTPRANGHEGLEAPLAANWRLEVTPLGMARSNRSLEMGDIRKLPRVEHITEFKCIEGWSKIVRWAGVRFSDFTEAYSAASSRARYVSLRTPDGGYYVGVDTASMLHPQTLLAYEMNGQPLSSDHGAPLRLVIPVKYGIKNIKRIGQITYTDSRPADYWAERGYDYYAAL